MRQLNFNIQLELTARNTRKAMPVMSPTSEKKVPRLMKISPFPLLKDSASATASVQSSKSSSSGTEEKTKQVTIKLLKFSRSSEKSS
jgi:hypothetical protein